MSVGVSASQSVGPNPVWNIKDDRADSAVCCKMACFVECWAHALLSLGLVRLSLTIQRDLWDFSRDLLFFLQEPLHQQSRWHNPSRNVDVGQTDFAVRAHFFLFSHCWPKHFSLMSVGQRLLSAFQGIVILVGTLVTIHSNGAVLVMVMGNTRAPAGGQVWCCCHPGAEETLHTCMFVIIICAGYTAIHVSWLYSSRTRQSHTICLTCIAGISIAIVLLAP